MFKNPNLYKVSWLLAKTRITRTSVLSNLLIILVMTLTFLNLLVVRGILIGLPSGVVEANEKFYFADVFVSTPTGKKYLDRHKDILAGLKKLDSIETYTTRYITSATLLADFDERVSNDETPNEIRPRIVGIDPIDEQKVTHINTLIDKGRMFSRDSTDEIMLGTDLLSQYGIGEAQGTSVLDNVDIGTELEITINGITKKVTVVGFLRSKTNEIDARAVASSELLKEFIPTQEFKPDEIAIRIKEGYTPVEVQKELFGLGLQAFADIETPSEYQPSFVEDIINTFKILGDFIGTVSLAVASITIFIIIFVNAITQRKQIGILKGIGITPFAIELSYTIQAIFYVTIGALISLPFLYGVLVPYFIANPIDFPFSDGIIVAEYSETASRTLLMFITTAIAGYLPARSIVQKNTLDAILGR